MGSEIRQDPSEHIRDLQQRLDEAEETLRALRSGGDRVYSVIVQGMAEGALTLTPEGLILFSNEQFATLMGSPLERVMGSRMQDFAAPEDAGLVSALLTGGSGRKAEVRLRSCSGALIPAYLSVEKLVLDDADCICLMVTDLSEQKRNQEIVAAEKLARSILEQAAEAILVVDPNGVISQASRAAERLAGAPVLQRAFDEVFRISLDPRTDVGFQEILSASGRVPAIHEIEVTALKSDGQKIDLLLSAGILSGPDSALLGCVIHLTDITERKRRERQLKFQADILETTSEAVIAVDPDNRVIFWNAGAERLYGIPAREAVGRATQELHDPLWLDQDLRRQAMDSLEKDGTWSGENIHVRRDGKQICVSLTVNHIAPEHGGGMFAVARDITEKKLVETILRESEARERRRAAESQAMMEAVPAAVFIARDPEGRDMVGNHMSYEVLGLPSGTNVSLTAPEGERPKHFHAMKNGEEIPPEKLPVQLAARTGRAVHDYEFDLVFDDGSTRSWLGNAVPIRNEAGQSRGAVGAFVDITERKRAEEHLQQSQKLESIGLLAGGIAHDFNNLLVGVMGNASLAQGMLPPEDPTAVFLERIIKSSERLAHLTGQMLAYAGKGKLLVERLDLSHLISEMEELVQSSIPKKIELDYILAPHLPGIEADRRQVQQIFMDLVLNAAEAIGEEDGRISVKTGVREVQRQYANVAELKTGTYVYLEVGDTGCGMNAVTKGKIFDPFFTTKFLGRGLGLAAVQGVVRSHKGGIVVSSAPGKGSTFTVLLPAAAENPAAVPRPVQRSPAATGTGTILVVDDHKGVRDLARDVLTQGGYEVLVANDGVEAIEILKTYPGDISLVVLDLTMPRMSGQEALPEIRKIRPGVKVIISSGYNEKETLALFEDCQVSGFIQKPYTVGRLAEKVKSALG